MSNPSSKLVYFKKGELNHAVRGGGSTYGIKTPRGSDVFRVWSGNLQQRLPKTAPSDVMYWT